MIGVSVVIRHGIDGKGSSSAAPSGPVTVACITELADACNALTNVTVRVEDASVTAKAIANGTAGIDGWITFDPWATMASLLAQRDLGGTTTALASSDVQIAMVTERLQALEPACGRGDWKCLGDTIGKQWTDVGGKVDWGQVKAGVPSRATASGTLL